MRIEDGVYRPFKVLGFSRARLISQVYLFKNLANQLEIVGYCF